MSVEAEIAKIVRQHGWYAASIGDCEPQFVYTIGLMETFDHAEFIVFGLERDGTLALLDALVDSLRSGERFDKKSTRTVRVGAEDHRIGLRCVHESQHPLYLGYAMGYCRFLGRIGELEAMQVFWPDPRGKFPFEAGFASEMSGLQPRLDVPLTPGEIEEFERQFE